MEKYSDDKSVGQDATIVAGPGKGKSGIVKAASGGTLQIQLPNGVVVHVEEDAVSLEKHLIKGS